MRTYSLDSINKTVILTLSFDEDIIREIKALDFNSRWNQELKHWVVPVNDYSIGLISALIKEYNFIKAEVKKQEDVDVSYKKTEVDLAYLKGMCDSKGFTYTPRDYQLEALAFGIEKGNIINGDDVGLGKCEYVKNKVFTPQGRKEIGELKVGDYVIGSNGKPTKVLQVHPQDKKKPLYRITFSDNFSLLVSGEHLFNVRSNFNKQNKFQTLSISQMLDETLVISRFGEGRNSKKSYETKTFYKDQHGGRRWSIPIVEPIQFENNEELPICPYLLGFTLGDGHIDKYGAVSYEIHKDDFEEVFNNYEFRECNSAGANTRGASIRYYKSEFIQLGLNGKLSYNKFIPKIYKYNTVENRLQLLRGLMDSDGWWNKTTNSIHGVSQYSTSSEEMADDVCEIVQSLGGIARKRQMIPSYIYKGIKKKGRINYQISIKLPNDINPFQLKRKFNLYKAPQKYKVNRAIKDISFERYDECVCISVEAEDNLYVTEHAIVTHNTFEAIMYAETTNSFPCLVIVPASVKYNWYEKWLEITGEKRNVSVIESKETKKHKNNWNADVVIINYDILGKKQGRGTAMKFAQLVETNWGMVVIDEAHFLKNKTSQRAQAAKKITQISDDIKIQLLTGTATMSKPVELWNLLKLCKVDEFIAVDWYQFVRRYCGGYKGKFGWVTDGATNTLELNKKLRETCYIRREKREVLTEMPDVTKQVIQMAITNMKDITAANTNFIQYIIDTKGEEAAEAAMEAEHLVALGMMRKLAIEGKAKAIELYLKDWKESGKKLAVFGIHKELLIHLAEKFKCPLIAGGVSSKQKQEIVKDWIKSDDIFLFANMESAGTGVDGLQLVCSNMLIIELPWRPSDLTQVIGRLDRSGQEEPVTVTFALSDDTIDSEMFEMLADKELVTEAVNKGIDIKRNGSGMRAVMKKIIKKSK